MTDPKLTPPPELVREWNQEATGTHFEPCGYSEFIAARAAQWGSDQELEACCEWLKLEGHEYEHEALLAARRPKPPSLKEQALNGLTRLETTGEFLDYQVKYLEAIRRALESIDD